MNRQPAVAGQFYPDNKAELLGQIAGFCSVPTEAPTPIGIISPHAGYIYSGAIAGKLFSQINIPDRIIILGPNHHGTGHPGAVYNRGAWQTPLGDIAIDQQLAGEVLASCQHLSPDDTAHRYEHSLEVQVPFVQYCNPEAKIVPVCIGHLSLPALIETGESLAGVISSHDEPILMLASSDMTHFESADAARKKDFLALKHVENLDAQALYRTVRENRISMCGVMPSVIMLAAARKLGAGQGDVVAYGTSGDVTGDQSDVVAYAGVIVN